MNWRKRDRAEGRRQDKTPTADSTAAHAVREAEQVVATAWIGRLVEADQLASQAMRACLHMHEQQRSVLEAAQLAGEPWLIVMAQRDLDAIDVDLADASGTREAIRKLLATQRQCRSETAANGVDRTATSHRSPLCDNSGRTTADFPNADE